MSENDGNSLPPAEGISLKALTSALQNDKEGGACHTFLGSDAARHHQANWQRVRFSEGLAQTFRNKIISQLTEKLLVQEVVSYQFDDEGQTTLKSLHKDQHLDLAKWFDQVPGPEFSVIFNGSESFLTTVRQHVTLIYIPSTEKWLKVFARRTKASLLRKRGVFAVAKGKSEFEEVKKDIYDFPTEIDFFEWDNTIFINNIAAFESLTNVRAISTHEANSAIDEIKLTKGLFLPDLAGVKDYLAQKPRHAKTIAAARQRGALKAINPLTLESRICDLKLKLKVSNTGSDVHIGFDTKNKEEIVDFIELVADMYTDSPTTGFIYKSSYKEVVRTRRSNL